MRSIEGKKFFTAREVQNLLEDEFKTTISVNAVKRKMNTLACSILVDNIMHVPEELIPYFNASVSKKIERLKVLKEIEEKLEKIKKELNLDD